MSFSSGGAAGILLLAVIGLYKIFALDFGLRADGAKRRTLDSGMVRDGHGCDGMIGIFSLQRNMIARADNFKSKISQGGKDFCFGHVLREFTHGTVTSVSAIKASLGNFDLFNTFGPKVLMWKRMADVVSARAFSYVSPSPTTTPSMPNGYPTYPSLSLAITILIGKCILNSSYLCTKCNIVFVARQAELPGKSVVELISRSFALVFAVFRAFRLDKILRFS